MEGRMQSMAAKAVDEPEILAHLTEGQTREVLAKLLPVTVAAIAKWVSYGQVDQIARQRAAGDRLLDAEVVAARLGCSTATLRRGWKSGRYPFILKDGGRLVGSEDSMERWIKNRTTRQFSSN